MAGPHDRQFVLVDVERRVGLGVGLLQQGVALSQAFHLANHHFQGTCRLGHGLAAIAAEVVFQGRQRLGVLRLLFIMIGVAGAWRRGALDETDDGLEQVADTIGALFQRTDVVQQTLPQLGARSRRQFADLTEDFIDVQFGVDAMLLGSAVTQCHQCGDVLLGLFALLGLSFAGATTAGGGDRWFEFGLGILPLARFDAGDGRLEGFGLIVGQGTAVDLQRRHLLGLFLVVVEEGGNGLERR